MSAIAPARPTPASPRPGPAPSKASGRPRAALTVVGAPRRVSAARVPFGVLVFAILGAGLVALLMLHTLAAQDAFTLHDLQHRTAALSDSEQQLALGDQQQAAPSELAARARALGMVPAASLTISRRADGRIVAIASAPPLPPPPAPTPTANASAAASPAASHTPKSSAGATSRHKATKPAKSSQAGHTH